MQTYKILILEDDFEAVSNNCDTFYFYLTNLETSYTT